MGLDMALALLGIALLVLARWAGVYVSIWRQRHHISRPVWALAVLSFLSLLIVAAYLFRHGK